MLLSGWSVNRWELREFDVLSRLLTGRVGERRRPDSNRGWRFCRPLPYHLATAPRRDPSGSTLRELFLKPSQRERTSNLTTHWSGSKPTSREASATPFHDARRGQANCAGQSERATHESG